MCDEALRLFVSENALKLHREYLIDIEHKISILRKSLSGLSDDIKDVIRGRFTKEIKREAASLFFERDCHRIFFNSFTEVPVEAPYIRSKYSSENAFVYEIYRYILKMGNGLFCVYVDRRGDFCFAKAEEVYPFASDRMLIVDACEHSYFFDYGFNREKYIRNALSHLNLARLCKD